MALRKGTLVAATTYSYVLTGGLLASDLLLMLVGGLAGSLALGVLVGAVVFRQAGRALARRRVSRGLAEVRVTKWHKARRGQQRHVSFGSHSYQLVLREDGWQAKAVLSDDTHTEVLTLPGFRYAVHLVRELKKQRLVVDAAFASEGAERIELAYSANGVFLRCLPADTVYWAERNAVVCGGVEVAVRDVLGWRVREDASPVAAAVCALMIAHETYRVAGNATSTARPAAHDAPE